MKPREDDLRPQLEVGQVVDRLRVSVRVVLGAYEPDRDGPLHLLQERVLDVHVLRDLLGPVLHEGDDVTLDGGHFRALSLIHI